MKYIWEVTDISRGIIVRQFTDSEVEKIVSTNYSESEEKIYALVTTHSSFFRLIGNDKQLIDFLTINEYYKVSQ